MDTTGETADRDPLRPTDHTALLLHVLRREAARFGKRRGLDMGVGSGVLLAALGLLGVAELHGVDADAEAVAATRRLLGEMGLAARADVRQGSLWAPVAGGRFDVVVANLPQFAALEPSDPDHSPGWSAAGADGRAWLDPFLAGLGAHLAEDGVAFMTHNVAADRARTDEILARSGLAARTAHATTMVLDPRKSALLHPAVRARAENGLSRIGPYEFIEVTVLEIRPVGTG